MRFIKPLFLPICIGLAAISFLIHPQASAEGISRGLSLCIRSILPSLFPFFVLSNLWVRYSFPLGSGKLFSAVFHLPAAARNSWLMGALGGYPTGAKTIVHQYQAELLTKNEANQALLFCCNAGPAFVIGVLGSLFQSPAIGLQLYIIHLMASIFVGIVLRPRHFVNRANPSQIKSSVSFSSVFVSSCADAVGTTVQVCGFLLFFCILTEHLQIYLSNPRSSVWPMVCGFLELTTGCKALNEAPLSEYARFVLSSALLGWGGLCVHGQAISFLPRELSAKQYLLGKILHCLVSLAFSCLFLNVSAVVWVTILLLFAAAKSSTGKKSVHQI